MTKFLTVEDSPQLAAGNFNNLKPTKKKEKNELRRYLIQKLGIKDLLPGTWKKYSKGYVERFYPKFNIWYWRPK